MTPRHGTKRGLGLSLLAAELGCARSAFWRDDPLKTMISAEHDLDVMCRGGSPGEFVTVEACKQRDKLVKILLWQRFLLWQEGPNRREHAMA